MKYLATLLAALVLLILAACQFHPVQSQADFAAMQTATAAVPPLPTVEPQVVPPTATEALVPTVTPEPTACDPVILGNIRNGKKTAFKPGDAPYSQVIPEATFCSMNDAVAGGFTPYRGN